MSRGSEPDRTAWAGRASRAVALVVLALLAVTLVWWGVGRATAEGRRLTVRHAPAPSVRPAVPDGEIRILAWNLAHGRGSARSGWLRNWGGGSAEDRIVRLARIARVLREADADVVVLNEVDFDAGWSGGMDQAEVLARAAGYPTWVEQRNVDLRFPFVSYAFGNAVLTRLAVRDARWVELPPHSRLETLALGSKAASIVRLEGGQGPLSVVPIHLEFRSEETRRAAVPVLEALRAEVSGPLILAGDFNTAPPGWPGTEGVTALGALLEAGWRSSRAEGPPAGEELTFPTRQPARALDWILVEPPLRVVEARVLPGVGELSDHAPVLAVVRPGAGPSRRSGEEREP